MASTSMTTKVGIFAPKYPPAAGGAAVYFRQVADLLQSTAYEPYVLTPHHDQRKSGHRVLESGQVIDSFPSGLVHGGAFVPRCWRLLRRLDPALVHVHPHFPQWRFYRWLVRGLGIPTVYDCRDRLFTPRHVSGGSHYLSAAPHIDELLVDICVDESSITRAPVAMPDIEPISPLAKPPDSPLVAFVGDLTAAKGVGIAIDAVERVRSGAGQAPVLHIAGDGPQRRTVDSRARDADWIDYHGALPHAEAVGLIDDADVLVLPSACEGRPRVVLEALAVGTPIVASDAGSTASMIGDAGRITGRTPESVASALRTVLADGEAGRRAREQDVGSSRAAVREALLAAYEATA